MLGEGTELKMGLGMPMEDTKKTGGPALVFPEDSL
jgi:hypothetical protein